MRNAPVASGRRRAVFLDVDGTYALHGVAPAAHVGAVRQARAAGHLVLLCTGRPVSMLPDHLMAAGFDGVVAAAGAYVLLGDEVLLDIRFRAELGARAVQVLEDADATYLLEAPKALYATPGTADRLAELFDVPRGGSGEEQGGMADIIASITVVDDPASVSFGKVSVMASRLSIQEIGAAIGDEVLVLPSSVPELGEGAGEIFLSGIHKAVGMRAVVERLGLDPADVVGIGDGLNDLEMLEYAGVGVAIEGSDERLLAVADRTAAGPHEEGLVAAFAELGLGGTPPEAPLNAP